MSIGVAAKIAQREMRGGLKGFRVLLICLALGIGAIAAVGSVREGILQGLEAQGAVILGGDAEIQLTYRFASEQERDWLDHNFEAVSEIADFRSMAVVTDGTAISSGLTQVKAVDDAYPLFGVVQLDPPMGIQQALAETDGRPGAVMDRLLVDRLGLEPGGVFGLGDQEFVLSAVLLREPDSATGSFTLGPRTIVRRSALTASGLLQPGTLFDSAYRLKTKSGPDFDQIRANTSDGLAGASFRWRDRRNGAPGATEFVDRLGSFLVLIGLAGLAVGGVGISSAIGVYLRQKSPVIAMLKTLGASGLTVFQIYFIQLGCLSVLGIALGIILGASLPFLIAPYVQTNLGLQFAPTVYAKPLIQSAVYGVLAAMLFSFLPLAKGVGIRPAALFRDSVLGSRRRPTWRQFSVTVALLIVLIGAVVGFSGNIRLTLWSFAGLFGAIVILLAVGQILQRTAGFVGRIGYRQLPVRARLVLAAIAGPRNEVTTTLLSLGLGLSVLATIGQIDTNLRAAIARDLPERAPSYFVVDIQPGQLGDYVNLITNNPAVSRLQTAPMLRGVITQINGRPASDTAGDHWVIQGDRGITYAAQQPEGTEVTSGKWWPEDYDGEPQISFSASEAAEMGLVLGDMMTVNILGRDITAKVTSFRNVDFSSAGMGFVMSMNPAAIAAAPHSYISTVYAKPEQEADILRALATTFPNMTAISVRQAVNRVAEVLGNIASAITVGALITLITGLVVLIGAAAAHERSRAYEAAILKTLGARRRDVLANFLVRSLLLGAAAGGVALLTGALAGWAVMEFLMEIAFEFSVLNAVGIIIGGSIVNLAASAFFTYRSLSPSAAQVLRNQQ